MGEIEETELSEGLKILICVMGTMRGRYNRYVKGLPKLKVDGQRIVISLVIFLNYNSNLTIRRPSTDQFR